MPLVAEHSLSVSLGHGLSGESGTLDTIIGFQKS